MDSGKARNMVRGVMFEVRGEENRVTVQVSGKGAIARAKLIKETLENLLSQLEPAQQGDLAAKVAAMIARDN